MTLDEIKSAVRNGQAVYWKNHHHPVEVSKRADGSEKWVVRCTDNNSFIGLTWQDGETMNGKPEEFHVAPYPKPEQHNPEANFPQGFNPNT